MRVRLARPGEGHLIRPILDRAAIGPEDSEDIGLWCKMLDANMRPKVLIQVCEHEGARIGAVLTRTNGLQCHGHGEEQTALLNRESLYVPFLAATEDAPFGTGRALGEAAIALARMSGKRMIIVLIQDERLYRYYRRLWPEGIYFEPGEASFFLRLETEFGLFPEVFTMAVQDGSRVGVMPLRPGIRLREFGSRAAMVGALEDFEESHAALGQSVPS